MHWSYSEAQAAGMRAFGVPKSFRRSAGSRAAIDARIHPLVEQAWRRLVSGMGESLADLAESTFLWVGGQRGVPNASAIAFSSTARMITVTPTLLRALIVVAAAINAASEAFVDNHALEVASKPKQLLGINESISYMTQQAKRVAEEVRVDGDLAELLDALREISTDNAELEDTWSRLNARGLLSRENTWQAQLGMGWVLGHEFAHHLLNHPKNSASPSGPVGRPILAHWLERIDPEPLRPRRDGHVKEFDADALATLLVESSWSRNDGFLSAGGASCALLTLALMEESAPGALGRESRTHPSLHSRLARQVELIGRAWPETLDIPNHPALDREASRQATGFLLQVVFVTKALAFLV